MKVIFCLVLVSASLSTAFCQKDPTLFSFGNQKVTKSEFEYVFNKNNANKKDADVEDLKEYLDLYINFKLKVAEAEALKIDTLPKVRTELYTYHGQLLKSYLDKEILNQLVKETYDRMTEEVRVAHILIDVKASATPSDTLNAYNKALNARAELIKGRPFETVAMEYSEDLSVGQNKGDLGYLTALQIPFYQFESAAYQLPIGEFSMPIRTSLGYHIIKPTNKRKASGTIDAAHILFKIPENGSEVDYKAAKIKADEVYSLLQNGGDWNELCAQNSEDLVTAKKGGKLRTFGIGKMVTAFENKAFALAKDGDISAPVKTPLGYHIIKRLAKYDIGSFEEEQDDLKAKLPKTQRYNDAKNALISRYKLEYTLLEYPDNLTAVKQMADSTLLQAKWRPSLQQAKASKPLFSIDGQKYSQKHFIQYLINRQRRAPYSKVEDIVQNLYNSYQEEILLNTGIGYSHPEYKKLRKEYSDGILLFELTEQNVWSKAVADSIGLQAFYTTNKDKFQWKQRVDANIYTYESEKLGKKIQKMGKKMPADQIITALNVDAEHPLIELTSGTFEKGANAMVDKVPFETGWHKATGMDAEKPFVLINIKKVYPAGAKSLEEARGFHIADYQDFLEKQWLVSLHKKYAPKVNNNVLQSIIVTQ